MIIRPPERTDWERFLTLVRSENWRVPQNELRLFQGHWAAFAHVLDDDGFCGKSEHECRALDQFHQRGDGCRCQYEPVVIEVGP